MNPSQGQPRGHNEEPEPTAEESVPSDGKDTDGEKMMEDLGRERQEKDAKGAPAPAGKRP